MTRENTVNVPREPTEAEIKAVHGALCGPAPAYDGPTNSLDRFNLLARHVARAMLSAAPLHEGEATRWLVERHGTNGVICWSAYEHELQARTVAKEEAPSWAGITVTPLYAAPPPSVEVERLREALEKALPALRLADDVLSRSPNSTRIWITDDGEVHPAKGIGLIRSAIKTLSRKQEPGVPTPGGEVK